MAVIKCKVCGGDMKIFADKTFGTCEFCGSTMTLPKIDDEQRAAAFNRGNHFRRIGEFDKALAVYERIVREDDRDAEAHWCCALCRFGIEYVEDPASLEYIPTCHRASLDSFLEDVDYLAAVEHSDGITKRQYQKDGARIAEVQRGILATSQKEEPYDVFICYKETDENGQRTRDSLMAQEIYYQLTEQGRRVFFARITLEDIVGREYEPYIFAALNSAKVMIVVGTKPEHLNAVWVKNEWSRFLAMMRHDRHKLLLPCYRDMDPYDLPEQLSILQSYDMAKIGFIQDLTRGVSKVLDAEKKPNTPAPQPAAVVPAANASTAPLLKRAFMFLEDGEWDSANEYCEKVLDLNPECAEAYVGKLMVALRVYKQDSLKNQKEPFDESGFYKKAVRFADESLKACLNGYIDHINTRNETARLNEAYEKAALKMYRARSEMAFREAAMHFKAIRNYRDAEAREKECVQKAEEARAAEIAAKREEYYNKAILKMKGATSEAAFREAASMFESIRSHRDAEACEKECIQRAEAARAAEIARKNRDDMLLSAQSNMRVNTSDAYRSAIKKLQSIPGWKNADQLLNECIKQLTIVEAAERKAKRKQEYLKKYPDVVNKDKYKSALRSTRDRLEYIKNHAPRMDNNTRSVFGIFLVLFFIAMIVSLASGTSSGHLLILVPVFGLGALIPLLSALWKKYLYYRGYREEMDRLTAIETDLTERLKKIDAIPPFVE